MNNVLQTVGQKLSASATSALHVRTGRMAQARVLATGALLTGVFFVSMNGIAHAGASDFNTYAESVTNKTNVAADIVTYVSYIGGAVLAALGIVDLKKHVENPSQTPMKNGLAKVGFGGALIAFPYLAEVATGTVGGTGSAEYQQFGERPTL